MYERRKLSIREVAKRFDIRFRSVVTVATPRAQRSGSLLTTKIDMAALAGIAVP